MKLVPTKKALLLLSGGIDSAVCLSLLQKQGLEVTTLSFRQEARLSNMEEVQCARALARQFGTRHIEVDLTSVDELIKDIPDMRLSLGGQINNCSTGTTQGAPMGVSVMLSMAFMHACSAGIKQIAWALHADDMASETIRRKVGRLIALHGELAAVQSPVHPEVILPLASFTKREIVAMAPGLGVDVATTFSCSGAKDGHACGECNQCLAREAALSPQAAQKVA